MMFRKCQLPKVTHFLCYAIFIFKMYLGETPFLSKKKTLWTANSTDSHFVFFLTVKE